MRSRAAFALVLGHLFFASTGARAEEAARCGEHGPWIRLRTDGLAPELQTELITQVRASLAAREIALCVIDEPSASEPLATLEVATTDSAVATSLVVADGVTHKRVSRDLDVRSVPPDGRALTIALALDELLRASWAELLLADARPTSPAPPVVTAAIRETAPARERATPRFELGAAFAGEHFGAGQDQLGPDVVARYFPWSRLGFEARVGLRLGRPAEAPRGEIRSSAFVVRPALVFALFPRTGRAGVDVLEEGFVAETKFIADAAAPDARGNERTVVAVYAVTSARGWLALGPKVRAFARVGGGVPLHTAYARDADIRLIGLAGVLLTGDLGIALDF
jgi:hypothetical protein